MTLIRRTNPFGELISLRSAMDRLFEDSWVRRHDGLLADDQPLALDVRTTSDAGRRTWRKASVRSRGGSSRTAQRMARRAG